MKHLFVLVFLFFIGIRSFGQATDEKLLYIEKAEKFSRMKRTGQSLTFLGTTLTVVGIVIMANSTTTTTYNGYGSQTRTDGNPGAGLAAYLIGSGCVGAGVPLWIVGGINKGKYERKLNALTVGASVRPQSASVSVRYRF